MTAAAGRAEFKPALTARAQIKSSFNFSASLCFASIAFENLFAIVLRLHPRYQMKYHGFFFPPVFPFIFSFLLVVIFLLPGLRTYLSENFPSLLSCHVLQLRFGIHQIMEIEGGRTGTLYSFPPSLDLLKSTHVTYRAVYVRITVPNLT